MAHLINNGLPFTRSRASEAGITENNFLAAFRTGTIRRMFRGVYVDSGVGETRDLRIVGLQLVMPRHAILCGCSAAWLLGADTFPPGRRFDFKPECVVPVGQARSRSPQVVCRRALIDKSDVTQTSGFLHTTALRTASDLLRTLRRPYALAAADTLSHAGLVSKDQVEFYVGRLRGYRGIAQARELAQLIEPQTESPGESWQRLRLIDAGFPRPTPQFVVTDRHGGVVGRLDNAYVEAKIGCEYDGKEFHSLKEDRHANAARRTALVDVFGWRMENCGNDDILGANPGFEVKVGEWLGITPNLPRNW